MIRKMLLDLDVTKGCGNDKITNKMLKLAAPSLTNPLFTLFSKVIECGVFPNAWKFGTIVPIYKNKGSKHDVANYRPITLLNSIPKVFERILYNSILKHVYANNLLYVNQSGYLKGHDTQKQLLQIVHMLKMNNSNEMDTRGVFLDIEGAFDAIPHYLLIHKFKSYGLGPTLVKILRSYLNNRSLRTKVNGCYSKWSDKDIINCGVPQGSILGPLLFLLYINDLSDVIRNCTLFLYADDSSLFLPVPRNIDPNIYHTMLQDDLNNMNKWSNIWKLKFKGSKSMEVIFTSPRRNPADYPQLRLNNEDITRGASHKHLGVILDNKLNFRLYIDSLVSKTNNMINPVKQLSSSLTSKHLEKIFMSFILPTMEYGSLVYSGASQSDLNKLDQVYYRAALLVSGCIHGSNKFKVFKSLGWRTLDDRRKEKMSILMFDYSSLNLPLYLLESIEVFRNHNRDVRLRQAREFIMPLSYSLCHSPILIAIKTWQSIPNEIRSVMTRNSFKFRIRQHINGKKNKFTTSKLNLTRTSEIYLNRARCDLLFKSHLYAHNFTSVTSPSCTCGYRNQTTQHILLHCPILLIKRRSLFQHLNQVENFENVYNSSNLSNKVTTLLNGNENLNKNANISVISLTAEYIKEAVDLLK